MRQKSHIMYKAIAILLFTIAMLSCGGSIDFEVTADDLAEELKEDFDATDTKYGGKTIRVHGKALIVREGIGGTISQVILHKSQSPLYEGIDFYVTANFSLDDDMSIGEIRTGQQITLLCTKVSVSYTSVVLSNNYDDDSNCALES